MPNLYMCNSSETMHIFCRDLENALKPYSILGVDTVLKFLQLPFDSRWTTSIMS